MEPSYPRRKPTFGLRFYIVVLSVPVFRWERGQVWPPSSGACAIWSVCCVQTMVACQPNTLDTSGHLLSSLTGTMLWQSCCSGMAVYPPLVSFDFRTRFVTGVRCKEKEGKTPVAPRVFPPSLCAHKCTCLCIRVALASRRWSKISLLWWDLLGTSRWLVLVQISPTLFHMHNMLKSSWLRW